MQLFAFAASNRRRSLNAQLLGVALACLRETQNTDKGIAVDEAAYEDCALPLFDHQLVEDRHPYPPAVQTLHERLERADVYVLAVPEYNWSAPSVVKNMIDWMSVYPQVATAGKPAFLMCATPSERGGVMGLSHTKMALEAVGTLVYPGAFTLGSAPVHLLDGELKDAEKQQRLRQQLQQFMTFAAQLCQPGAAPRT